MLSRKVLLFAMYDSSYAPQIYLSSFIILMRQLYWWNSIILLCINTALKVEGRLNFNKTGCNIFCFLSGSLQICVNTRKQFWNTTTISIPIVMTSLNKCQKLYTSSPWYVTLAPTKKISPFHLLERIRERHISKALLPLSLHPWRQGVQPFMDVVTCAPISTHFHILRTSPAWTTHSHSRYYVTMHRMMFVYLLIDLYKEKSAWQSTHKYNQNNQHQ